MYLFLKYVVIVGVAIYHLHNHCYAVFPEGIEKHVPCYKEDTKPQTPVSADKQNTNLEKTKKTCKNINDKTKKGKGKLNTGITGVRGKLPGNADKKKHDEESIKFSLLINSLYEQLEKQFNIITLENLKDWNLDYFHKEDNSMVKFLSNSAKFYKNNESDLMDFFKQSNSYSIPKFVNKITINNKKLLLQFFEKIDDVISEYLEEEVSLLKGICEGKKDKVDFKVSLENVKNVVNIYKIFNVSLKILDSCYTSTSGVVNEEVAKACMASFCEFKVQIKADYRISVKRKIEQWNQVKGILIYKKQGVQCYSLILHLLNITKDENRDITNAKVYLISLVLDNFLPRSEMRLGAIEHEILKAIRLYISKFSFEYKKMFHKVCNDWFKEFCCLLPKYNFFEKETTQCFLLSEKAFDVLTRPQIERPHQSKNSYSSMFKSLVKIKNKSNGNDYDLAFHVRDKPFTGFDLNFYEAAIREHIKDDVPIAEKFTFACKFTNFTEYLDEESIIKCLKLIFDNEALFSALITNYDVMLSNGINPDWSRVLIGQYIPGFIDEIKNCSLNISWVTPLMLKHLITSCSVYIDKIYEKQKKNLLKSKDVKMLVNILKLYFFIDNMDVGISYASSYLIELFTGCFSKHKLQKLIKYIITRIIRSGDCQIYPSLFTMHILNCVLNEIQDVGYENSPHVFSYVNKTTRKLKKEYEKLAIASESSCIEDTETASKESCQNKDICRNIKELVQFINSQIDLTDSKELQSINLKIVNCFREDALILTSATPESIRATWFDSSTGILKLNGNSSAHKYKSVIKNLRLMTSPKYFNICMRNIEIAINDGVNTRTVYTQVLIGDEPSYSVYKQGSKPLPFLRKIAQTLKENVKPSSGPNKSQAWKKIKYITVKIINPRFFDKLSMIEVLPKGICSSVYKKGKALLKFKINTNELDQESDFYHAIYDVLSGVCFDCSELGESNGFREIEVCYDNKRTILDNNPVLYVDCQTQKKIKQIDEVCEKVELLFSHQKISSIKEGEHKNPLFFLSTLLFMLGASAQEKLPPLPEVGLSLMQELLASNFSNMKRVVSKLREKDCEDLNTTFSSDDILLLSMLFKIEDDNPSKPKNTDLYEYFCLLTKYLHDETATIETDKYSNKHPGTCWLKGKILQEQMENRVNESEKNLPSNLWDQDIYQEVENLYKAAINQGWKTVNENLYHLTFLKTCDNEEGNVYLKQILQYLTEKQCYPDYFNYIADTYWKLFWGKSYVAESNNQASKAEASVPVTGKINADIQQYDTDGKGDEPEEAGQAECNNTDLNFECTNGSYCSYSFEEPFVNDGIMSFFLFSVLDSNFKFKMRIFINKVRANFFRMDFYGARSVIKKEYRRQSQTNIGQAIVAHQQAWLYRVLASNDLLLRDILSAKDEHENTINFIFTLSGETKSEATLMAADSVKKLKEQLLVTADKLVDRYLHILHPEISICCWEENYRNALSLLERDLVIMDRTGYSEQQFHFLNVIASLLATKGHIAKDMNKPEISGHLYDSADRVGPVRQIIKEKKPMPKIFIENSFIYSEPLF